MASVLILGMPANAFGQPIVIGPYRFADETPFADTAAFYPTPLTPSPLDRWRPISPEHNPSLLVGYSPDGGLINLGSNNDPCPPCSTGRELLDLGFLDLPAVNGPGPDLVIFDARWSADDYEVAVRPRGGALTPFLFHLARDQRPTGAYATYWSGTGAELWGVEIDLTRYGIPIGVEVDLLQIAGDATTNPAGWSEADPVMAAVLHGPCACDDGIECTWDCDPSGACISRPHDPGTPCSTGVCDGAVDPSCVECVGNAQCNGDRPRCDRSRHECVECVEDLHCDDGHECTTGFCTAGTCAHTILAPGVPCSEGMCDGAVEPACVECIGDGDCEDGVECTLDRCVDGACERSSAPRGAACIDGMCDGAASPRCVRCSEDADCGELSPFCAPDGHCIECREDAQCDDELECTHDTCAEGACAFDALPSGTPCRTGMCNGDPAGAACVECTRDEDCDDGRDCTEDACDSIASACVHVLTCTDAGLIPGVDAGLATPPVGCSCGVATPRHRGVNPLPSFLACLLAIAVGRAGNRRRERGRSERGLSCREHAAAWLATESPIT